MWRIQFYENGSQLVCVIYIHFLSRSLPRLDKIKWCQPEEYMVDDMDEYLNDQYEQELKDFYTEAREEARARKIKTDSLQTWWIYLKFKKKINISS